MSLINQPYVSKFIVGFYLAMILFVFGEAIFLMYVLPGSPLKILVAVVLSAVEVILVLLLISIYRVRYIVSGDTLIIKATRLIGGSKRIRLGDIVSAERTLTPFGIRLFGASLLGGYCYIPSLGRAFVVMTNFRDCVLIRAKHGNYIITPREPEKFIEAISVVGRKMCSPA